VLNQLWTYGIGGSISSWLTHIILGSNEESPPRHWEYGIWDLPLHMGFGVLNSKYDMDTYMATLFGGEAHDLCYSFGSSKKLDPTLKSDKSQEIFAKNNQNMIFIKIHHTLMISWRSKVGTFHPCWDLQNNPALGLGTPCKLPLIITTIAMKWRRGMVMTLMTTVVHDGLYF